MKYTSPNIVSVEPASSSIASNTNDKQSKTCHDGMPDNPASWTTGAYEVDE